jgi:DNA-binding LacI/PurR family transcriptional regulator
MKMPKAASHRPGRVTQQDIAKFAKVSQATVSRVLAGDERVEPSIRSRVAAVMHEHNYQPDVRARNLRKKSTGLIGLVVKRPAGGLSDDPFFANLIAGIMDYLAGTPYHLCIDTATSALGQASVYDEMLRTRRVDGLILVESEARDERIGRLQRDHFPFVLIGNPMENENLWTVDNDNVNAGYTATKHLLDSGFQNVGFLAGPAGLTVSEDRASGYKQAILEAGSVPRVWHSEFGYSTATQMAELILDSHDRPDGLVVMDDFMAMGVVRSSRFAGIRIPHDLGLVSFNDSSLCNFLDVGLTSISLNIPKIVAVATERLLEIIQGRMPEGPRRLIVNTELRARGSSVKLAGGKK